MHGTLLNQLGNQGGSLSTHQGGVRRVLRFLETLARGTQQSTLDALPIPVRSSAGVVASAAQSTHSVGGRGYSESSHGVSSVITRALGVLTVLTRWGTLSTHSGYTESPIGVLSNYGKVLGVLLPGTLRTYTGFSKCLCRMSPYKGRKLDTFESSALSWLL